MQLSKNFSLAELTKTDTGLDNTPSIGQLSRLKNTANNLEVIRAALGRPIICDSTFRSLAVNTKVGGAKNSAHLDGDASDIRVPGLTNKDICSIIIKLGIKFDQLIDENKHGVQWVHISFAPALRQQYLVFNDGKYEVHSYV